MKKIILRYFIYALLISFLSIFIFNFWTSQIKRDLQEGYSKENQVLFSILADKLNQAPQAEWQAIIKSWRAPYASKLKILSIDEIAQENNDVIKQINTNGYAEKHDWVHFHIFGSYRPHASIFVRIGKTNYVLQIKRVDAQFLVNRFLYWLTKPVVLEFEENSKNNWDSVIKKFAQETPNWVISIYPYTLEIIPAVEQEEFKKHHYAVEGSKVKGDLVVYHIFYYNQLPYILSMRWHSVGTYPYQAIMIWMLCFISICLLIVFFVLPLQRALVKLNAFTAEYGKGHFNAKGYISRWSTLYSLYQNIKRMGQKVESLLQTNKDVTYGLSHELKTPLYRVQFALNELAESAQTEEQKQLVESIREDKEEMDQLIEHIMLYARVERASEHITLDLQEIIPWLQQYVRSQEKKLALQDIVFESNIDISGNIMVNYDPKYLEILLNNLISNGVKYGNGQVKLTVKLQHKAQLVIKVEDNGCGISEDEIEQALTPFKRLKGVQNIPGHGLGLNLIKKITAWHKGTFSIERSILGGAKMVLVLPTNYK
jgi:signal transduction histidine kinase